jgi:prepilin-type processing-associated H-X9-DG protein
MCRKGFSRIEIIVIVLLVGVLVILLLLAFSVGRKSIRRTACVGNLKQIGIALWMYSTENKDRYPPVDDTKHNFIFNANLLYPEYLSDHMLAACPGNLQVEPGTAFRLTSDHSVDGTPKGQVHADCFSGDSYIYLGWLVWNDKEAETFFEAYDKLPLTDYDDHIHVLDGWGNAEGDKIYRLSAYVDRFFTDINFIGSEEVGASVVPIMWDRQYIDPKKFSHRPIGGNVLYLDGHVDYFRDLDEEYPPMTKTMARLLEERPREPIPDCE